MLAWMDAEGVNWELAHALLVEKGYRLDEQGLIATCAFVRQAMRLGLEVPDIDQVIMEMATEAIKDADPLKVIREWKPPSNPSSNPNTVLSLEWLDYAFQIGCNPLARLIASKYESITMKIGELVRLREEDMGDGEDRNTVACRIQTLRKELDADVSRAFVDLKKLRIVSKA